MLTHSAAQECMRDDYWRQKEFQVPNAGWQRLGVPIKKEVVVRAENRLSSRRDVSSSKDFPARIRFLRYILSMHGHRATEEKKL
jgi:hypothetical protein